MPSPRIFSNTKGVSFVSNCSISINMCSTNKERENMRFHPDLHAKNNNNLIPQSVLLSNKLCSMITAFSWLTGLWGLSSCSSLHNVSHRLLNRSVQWELEVSSPAWATLVFEHRWPALWAPGAPNKQKQHKRRGPWRQGACVSKIWKSKAWRLTQKIY